MRHGAGPGRTRDDHLDVAAQLMAALARARQLRALAELMGQSALSEADQRYLAFAEAVTTQFMRQRRDEIRSIDETLDRAWRALATLPRHELTLVAPSAVAMHLAAEHA
jgi:V/A-type H+-transporting ATPase subunit B